MAEVDWSILGASKRGLAVEGKNDKIAIEAFLDAGERQQLWGNWRDTLEVAATDNGGFSKVLNEVKPGTDARIWGLIDRDWRTDAEIAELQQGHPRLLILPRTMIENYCIDPAELEVMLPRPKRFPTLQSDIENHLDIWVRNGALWQTFTDQGAFQFCRGHETG